MQRGHTGWLVSITGLGGGLLILLFNLADLIKGSPVYEPNPIPTLVLGVAAAAAYGAIVLGPIGRALAKRILSEGEPSDQVMGDVRAMFETVQHQLAETNDRLDFTERLLAQARNPDQLPR